jgi:hypothetical protein
MKTSAEACPVATTPACRSGRKPLRGPHGPVPHVAMWSRERSRATLISTPEGIGYADETSADRDAHGVLWERAPSRPGEGEADYRMMHPLRQRTAMLELLCQVCAGPADQNEQGTLWLLPDHRDDWPNWPNGMGNTQPPLCRYCARTSAHTCPSLRGRFVAIRGHSTVAGVSGTYYLPGPLFPRIATPHTATLDDPNTSWIVASHLVGQLHDCTLVELP